MSDIFYAKRNFKKYVKGYNCKNFNIKRKVKHTYRVMKITKRISRREHFSKEDTNLALIIALLHDIARFEQFTKFNTFRDVDSFDHGEMAVQILQKNNFIRKFIKTNKYDEIIYKAIANHNKYKVELNLNLNEEKFVKLIRDADKVDILNEAANIFWKTNQEKKLINNSKVDEEVFNCILRKKTIQRRKNTSRRISINSVLVYIAFVFDINYKSSFNILRRKKYVNKIIHRFRLQDESSRRKIIEINSIANLYIEKEGAE